MVSEKRTSSLPVLDASGGVNMDDIEDDHYRRDRCSKCLRRTRQVILLLRHGLMLLGNIVAWYATNGLNGIAMQRTAVALREDKYTFQSIVANTAVITALQLFLGACLGRVLLTLYSFVHRKKPVPLALGAELFQPAQVLLAILHSIGSVSTNLGFMFGSASLVQIIKLMEPFQTLILSKLFSEEGKQITPGIITSMSVTVGAALSLIKSRPQTPPALAVVFAILSGFTLSSRNVLQRHQYISGHQASSTILKQPQDEQGPLERALVQFTYISIQSALLVTALSLPILLMTPTSQIIVYTQQGALRSYGDVLVWHPLYNAFSMITLGFCSALTHSLLNAGKRVVAIAMAIVWFREGFTTRKLMSLVLTLVGGCWYTCESRSKGASQQSFLVKFAPAIAILYLLFIPQWEDTMLAPVI